MLNIITQILSIYKVLLSLFRDISVLIRIQIPLGAVLPIPRGNGAILCMRPKLSAINSKNYIVPIWMI